GIRDDLVTGSDVCSSDLLLWLKDVPGSASRIAVDSLSLLVYPLVGARIATRHPSNAIGWIFGAIGVASQLYPAAQRAWIAAFARSEARRVGKARRARGER